MTLTVTALGLLQQSYEPSQVYHDSLGYALIPGPNSSPVSYFTVRTYDDPAQGISSTPITRNEFLAIASGWGTSSVNPKNENLFAKYGVQNCGYFPDTIIRHVLYKGGVACSPVDNLWRLYCGEYPFFIQSPVADTLHKQDIQDPGVSDAGWANDTLRPSDGQIGILQGYGVRFFTDIIYGENAFHLLHDMQDPAWVSNYKSH
ncbi:MAG TPA: hypothetical protein VFU15_06375 [Bacteroidia bacterium]|nr:hypothetical protein [Bacteroidia bacterium]